jgi:hypothetical protein
MRRTFAIVLVPLAALGLVACGGAGSGTGAGAGSPLAVLLAAADTTATTTSKMATEITVKLAGVSSAVQVDGAIDFKAKAAHLTMGLPGQLTHTEVVVLDKTVYVKMPEGAPNPSGKPWVKVDTSSASGKDLFAEDPLGATSDPTATLEQLRRVGNVTRVGADQVRGEKTDHYRADVDLTKATPTATPEQKAKLDELISALGTSTLPTDVWIDHDGRLRRMRMDMTMTPPARAGVANALPGSVSMTMQFDLFDFGTEVDAVAPPADQVADAPPRS